MSIIKLRFKEIIGNPEIRITLNTVEFYSGPVKPEISIGIALLDFFISDSEKMLEIHYSPPKEKDSFEIEKIFLNGEDVQNLLWNKSTYLIGSERYDGCTLFKPAGRFCFSFGCPTLSWILSNLNPGDDSWKEDYEYYCFAKRILNVR